MESILEENQLKVVPNNIFDWYRKTNRCAMGRQS